MKGKLLLVMFLLIAGYNVSAQTTNGASTILVSEKSILKDNKALIVIDGMIVNNYNRPLDPTGLAGVDFGNGTNDIDPQEIASINVLDGQAASAAYGTAGANGAVLITTKNGNKKDINKSDKTDLHYKTSSKTEHP